MDQQHLLALYTAEQRRTISYPDSRREVLPQLVRHVNTLGRHEGTILYSELDESTVDTVIGEQIAWSVAHNQALEWKVYDYDHPADLLLRLADHGFVVGEAEAILVLDLAQLPPALQRRVTTSVRPISTPAELPLVRAIQEQVWGGDFGWLEAYLAAVLQHDPTQMSIYVAYADGLPASAGWIYFPPQSQFASLWGGATVAEQRGRGLYTALLAMRAQEALRRGVRYLTVDAGPQSQPILARLGFIHLATAYACRYG
jgi:GNAT superfamily N-acetyltransferase